MLYTRELKLSDEYPKLAERKDIDKILKMFAEELEAALKSFLLAAGYYELAYSVNVIPTDKGVRVEMLEYGKYLDLGVKPHAMIKHVNKTIPITLPDGTVIFRKVTTESIVKGAWRHPGIKALRFIDDIAEETADRIASEVGV